MSENETESKSGGGFLLAVGAAAFAALAYFARKSSPRKTAFPESSRDINESIIASVHAQLGSDWGKPRPDRTDPTSGRIRCSFCDGRGRHVCFACRGSRLNRGKSSPRWTGNAVADALLSVKHDVTCKSCGGHPDMLCERCRGTGYID